jgi:hypothetical protein
MKYCIKISIYQPKKLWEITVRTVRTVQTVRTARTVRIVRTVRTLLNCPKYRMTKISNPKHRKMLRKERRSKQQNRRFHWFEIGT